MDIINKINEYLDAGYSKLVIEKIKPNYVAISLYINGSKKDEIYVDDITGFKSVFAVAKEVYFTLFENGFETFEHRGEMLDLETNEELFIDDFTEMLNFFIERDGRTPLDIKID